MSLVSADIFSCIDEIPLGPDFSNHVWSASWLASVCPKIRLIFGVSRWTVAGKYPSIFEKLCSLIFGVVFSCFEVMLASSIAVNKPISVTIRAPSLSIGGIVIIGVLIGVMFDVRMSPATILPQASRLIGLITFGSFSLIGDSGRNRGVPMDTKKITRKL